MLTNRDYDIDKNAETMTRYSNNLSEYIVTASLPSINKEVPFGKEGITIEIYKKAVRRMANMIRQP